MLPREVFWLRARPLDHLLPQARMCAQLACCLAQRCHACAQSLRPRCWLLQGQPRQHGGLWKSIAVTQQSPDSTAVQGEQWIVLVKKL